ECAAGGCTVPRWRLPVHQQCWQGSGRRLHRPVEQLAPRGVECAPARSVADGGAIDECLSVAQGPVQLATVAQLDTEHGVVAGQRYLTGNQVRPVGLRRLLSCRLCRRYDGEREDETGDTAPHPAVRTNT